MATEFPRGPLLYRRGLVVAHRTTSVDSSPAELWELDPVMRAAWTRTVDGDHARDLMVDFAHLPQQHPLPSFGRVVHASETEVVIAAPPWVPLSALGEPLAPAFVVTWLHDLAGELAAKPEVVLPGLTPSLLAITVTGAPRVLDLMRAQFPGATVGRVNSGVGWSDDIPFLAPEQTAGKKLDAKRDIWSLAAIAISLLTGKRLFDNESSFETLENIRSGNLVRPNLDRVLLELFEPMLVIDPEARASAAEVAKQIERDFALWSPQQMFDEVRRIAPDAARAAIEYGY